MLASPYKEGAHLPTIKTANNGILARTGMRHWTPHDLRRTAASKMSAMGTDRRVLQAILNHKDHSVTAVYDRYTLDRVSMPNTVIEVLTTRSGPRAGATA